MTLDISREKYQAFTEEEKELLKEYFTFNSVDKCWHSINLEFFDGVVKLTPDDDADVFSPIADRLGVYPTIYWTPSKEQYKSLDIEAHAKVRELFYWNKKEAVWVSRQDKGQEAKSFLFTLGDKAIWYENKAEIAQAKLEQGIAEIKSSDELKEFLNAVSKFYNYSPQNQLLIAAQKPDATYVASKYSWYKDFGRSPVDTAKGVYILAPIVKKIPAPTSEQLSRINSGQGLPKAERDNMPTKETVIGFRTTKVYDISETGGKPLPKDPIEPKKLTGTVENFNNLKLAIEATVKDTYPVSYVPQKELGTANGVTCFAEGMRYIKVSEELSESQKLKTLVHEVAHATIHDPKQQKLQKLNTARSDKEVQAEATAYIVCQRYGIDSSDYSFGYVAGWGEYKTPGEIANDLKIAATAANGICSRIDKEMQKTQSMDLYNEVLEDTSRPETAYCYEQGNYALFFSDDYKSAEAYANQNKWSVVFVSENRPGVNGDSYLVYGDADKLPKYFQDLAEPEEQSITSFETDLFQPEQADLEAKEWLQSMEIVHSFEAGFNI